MRTAISWPEKGPITSRAVLAIAAVFVLLMTQSAPARSDDCDAVLLARTAEVTNVSSSLRLHWFNAATEESFSSAKTKAGGAYGPFSASWSQAEAEQKKASSQASFSYDRNDSLALLRLYLPESGFAAWLACKQSDPINRPLFETRIEGTADALEFLVTLYWQPPVKNPAPLKSIATTLKGVTDLPKELALGSKPFTVSRRQPSDPILGAVTGQFGDQSMTLTVRVPAYRPAVLPQFPVNLTRLLLTKAANRGGPNPFADGGFVITSPPNGGEGYATFRIPIGARFFHAILTEYSGASCNGGNASSSVWVDGAKLSSYAQGVTTNQVVTVGLPIGASELTLKTSDNGDSEWCDDPAWMNAAFDFE